LITVADSDAFLVITQDKSKRKQFFDDVYHKKLGQVCTTAEISQTAYASLRNKAEIRDFFENLKDFRVESVGIDAFADACLFCQKYRDKIKLELSDWITAVFIRNLKETSQNVRLLSSNRLFDRLASLDNPMHVERFWNL
jgi:hypothetical protein